MVEFSETGTTRRNVLPNLMGGSIDLFYVNEGTTRAYWRNNAEAEHFVCVSGLAVLVYFRSGGLGYGSDTQREILHPYLEYSTKVPRGYYMGFKAFADGTVVMRHQESPDRGLTTLPWDHLGPEIWDAAEERI